MIYTVSCCLLYSNLAQYSFDLFLFLYICLLFLHSHSASYCKIYKYGRKWNMEVEEIDRYISIKKFFINIGNIVCINLYMVYSFIVYY